MCARRVVSLVWVTRDHGHTLTFRGVQGLTTSLQKRNHHGQGQRFQALTVGDAGGTTLPSPLLRAGQAMCEWSPWWDGLPCLEMQCTRPPSDPGAAQTVVTLDVVTESHPLPSVCVGRSEESPGKLSGGSFLVSRLGPGQAAPTASAPFTSAGESQAVEVCHRLCTGVPGAWLTIDGQDQHVCFPGSQPTSRAETSFLNTALLGLRTGAEEIKTTRVQF